MTAQQVGEFVPSVAQSNAALCVDYLSWLRDTKRRSGVTVYNYTSTLTRLLDHLGNTTLEHAKLWQLEAYVRRPRGGRAHGEIGSASSQAKDVAIIRSMYSYLVNRGLIRTNPAALLGAPKVNNANPRPIPDHDWMQLWSAATPGVERIALGLGFFVGLRRREVCELTPAQVFSARECLVNFKRKGGGDDVTPYADLCRVIDHSLPALKAGDFPAQLDAYAGERTHARFLVEWGEHVPAAQREQIVHELPPGMTDPGLLNRRLRVLCDRAGVPPYTPHQLRHSFVTNLLRSGVPLHLVSRMANHSSPTITNRYIKAGSQELREWFRTVNRHG